MHNHSVYAISVAAILCAASGAAAVTPAVTWVYEAQSNLYAPPLVADMHPAAGLETVIADSEAKTLRCIDAQGRQVWECRAGWKKRLIASTALSSPIETGPRLLVIGNADGTLTCIRAEDGAVVWRKPIGAVEWGGALWTDLTGDGVEEIVYGTEKEGIFALDRDANTLWRYPAAPDTPAPVIPGMLAAADTDEDGRAEVFAVAQNGPFCLNPDGTLSWERRLPHYFLGGPSITHWQDDNDHWRLFCISRNDNALWIVHLGGNAECLKTPLPGSFDTYSAASCAFADVSGDGIPEVAFGDAQGRVSLYRTHRLGPGGGRQLWSFALETPAHSALSMGDVDGDGRVETLAAAGDRVLYCLDDKGRLKWRFEGQLRFLGAPAIADVDLDGRTDILVCGSDRRLYCLGLCAGYDAERISWPSARADAALTGARTVRKQKRPEMVRVSRTLFEHGDFESGKPLGPDDTTEEARARRQREARAWTAQPDGCCARDDQTVSSGTSSLRITPGGECVSDPIPVPPHLQYAFVETRVRHAGNPHFRFFWRGTVAETDNVPPSLPETDWRRLAFSLYPDPQEESLTISCLNPRHERLSETEDEYRMFPSEPLDPALTGDAWFDAIQVVGVFVEPRCVEVLINQVGYDAGAPKSFVVQSNADADNPTFNLLRGDKVLFSGELAKRGRIQGAFGQDWGHVYWRGDFSEFDEPGTYRIRVTVGRTQAESYEFEIGENLVWQRTVRPAYRYFYYQRCGTAVPGFHKACHVDDSTSPEGAQFDCWGGWHDAGDYNKYHNAPYVLGLEHVYAMARAAFDAEDADSNGRADLLDEIVWGADHARRMVAEDGSTRGGITTGYGYWGSPEMETDNLPGTGDERPLGAERGDTPDHHHAAVSRLAVFLAGAETVVAKGDDAPVPVSAAAWIETARRSLRWALDSGRRGPCQLTTALDLYELTGEAQYADLAKALVSEMGLGPLASGDIHGAAVSMTFLEALRRFDRLFGEDHGDALRDALVARADGLLSLADNPFGVCTFGPPEKPNFFGTPQDTGGWHVGTNSYLLGAAAAAALAYQYTHDENYRRFAYDQINWVLGMNPFNTSLMEGSGDAFPPTYHHRYTFSGVKRDAVPGSVINGITWRAPGDDRPSLDLTGVDIPAFESNECWLPHNVNYLDALACLRAIK
ncbi:MAG: glycoside hydrolase family 9 protein [Candidatus Hydrogenedentes bacterium]|nr:glycoside hydrolase family 9 protein [Candidatus Hydrogenedentota bacterium]